MEGGAYKAEIIKPVITKEQGITKESIQTKPIDLTEYLVLLRKDIKTHVKNMTQFIRLVFDKKASTFNLRCDDKDIIKFIMTIKPLLINVKSNEKDRYKLIIKNSIDLETREKTKIVYVLDKGLDYFDTLWDYSEKTIKEIEDYVKIINLIEKYGNIKYLV